MNQIEWQRFVGKRLLEEKRPAFILVMFADELEETRDCTNFHAGKVLEKAMGRVIETPIWESIYDLISTCYSETEICPIEELLDATINKPTKKKD